MKILIVEDEAELAKSISEYLSEENYLCENASTFSEAMNKIEQFDYDCILLDIMLPDGNGLRILEELKNRINRMGLLSFLRKMLWMIKLKVLNWAQMIILPNLFTFLN